MKILLKVEMKASDLELIDLIKTTFVFTFKSVRISSSLSL